MRKIDIKEIPVSFLIIAGIIASIMSFLYYFALKKPYDSIYWLLCLIDFLLFIMNAYRVIACFDLSKVKTVIFSIVTIVGFFVFCVIVVFAFTAGTQIEHTFELFWNVLRVSLFLSPSFILLLPVMVLIAEIMS